MVKRYHFFIFSPTTPIIAFVSIRRSSWQTPSSRYAGNRIRRSTGFQFHNQLLEPALSVEGDHHLHGPRRYRAGYPESLFPHLRNTGAIATGWIRSRIC